MCIRDSGYYEKLLSRFHQFHGNYFVIFFKLNGSYAAGDSSHRPYVLLGEAYTLSVLCDYDDIVISAGLSDIYQLIAFFQIHGDQSRLPVSIEVGQGGLLDLSLIHI